MRKPFLILLLCCLQAFSMLSAQEIYTQHESSSQLSGRIGFEVEKKLPYRFTLNWEEEVRFKNNLTALDRINSNLSVDYDCLKYLKVGVGYTFLAIYHDGKKSTNYQKYWDLRHRINADATLSYKYMRWKFSLRERFLTTFRTDDPDLLEKANPKMQLRSRIGAEYSFFNKPVKPFATFEISNTLNAPKYAQGDYIDGLRTQAGVKWRLNLRNALHFYYRFDVNFNRDIDVDYKKDDITIKAVYVTHKTQYNHILGVVYAFDWK